VVYEKKISSGFLFNDKIKKKEILNFFKFKNGSGLHFKTIGNILALIIKE
jgi:hypothetical protein